MAIEQMPLACESRASERAVSGRRRSLWQRLWKARVAYLMIAPMFLLLFVFMYYPAVTGLYRSFFDWSFGLMPKFVGLGNFVTLFTDDKVFVSSLGNMAQLAAWYLFTNVVISVAVAVLIHRLRHEGTKYAFRVFMALPVVIPGIVLLMLWKFIYDATVGPLNAILIAAGLEDWTRAWLSDPRTALYAVMLRNFPWVDGVSVLILLAGFQAIPVEVVESAMLDGADGLRRLVSIELPLIAGQVKLISVLTLMWGVQEFTAVFAMTRGGPINKTQVPGMWMYWNAFNLGKMGYASAMGVVMFIITLILTMLNMKYITTQEY